MLSYFLLEFMLIYCFFLKWYKILEACFNLFWVYMFQDFIFSCTSTEDIEHLREKVLWLSEYFAF